jgi:2-iminobutanoate/2-iminopropanoate deaminase
VAKQPVAGSRPAGAYSPGIIAEGRFLYVSGQGPLRDGAVVGETAAEQTRITLENLGAVLAAAGAGPADVVRCGVFLADMADFAEMNGAYAEFFADPLPARTTVGVALAGFKVEIDCVAVLPAGEPG